MDLSYGPEYEAYREQVVAFLAEPWPLSFVVDYVLAPTEGAAPPIDISELAPTTVIALAAGGVVFFAAAPLAARVRLGAFSRLRIISMADARSTWRGSARGGRVALVSPSVT